MQSKIEKYLFSLLEQEKNLLSNISYFNTSLFLDMCVRERKRVFLSDAHHSVILSASSLSGKFSFPSQCPYFTFTPVWEFSWLQNSPWTLLSSSNLKLWLVLWSDSTDCSCNCWLYGPQEICPLVYHFSLSDFNPLCNLSFEF